MYVMFSLSAASTGRPSVQEVERFGSAPHPREPYVCVHYVLSTASTCRLSRQEVERFGRAPHPREPHVCVHYNYVLSTASAGRPSGKEAERFRRASQPGGQEPDVRVRRAGRTGVRGDAQTGNQHKHLITKLPGLQQSTAYYFSYSLVLSPSNCYQSLRFQ